MPPRLLWRKGSIRARDCAASGSAGFKRGAEEEQGNREIYRGRGKLRRKMGESTSFFP